MLLHDSFLWDQYGAPPNEHCLASRIQRCHAAGASRDSGKGSGACLPCVLSSISSGSVQISTLRSVHELGIIHNDVKPENIVTTTNQSFYLIDWGSARYKSDSVPHFPVGTPAYMSLRALEGECTLCHTHPSSSLHKYHSANNERNDLESLLYTLLYAAYGQLPWALNEPKAKSDFVFIARQRRAFRVQQISSLCPDVLQRFLDICRFDQYVCHPNNTGLCVHILS